MPGQPGQNASSWSCKSGGAPMTTFSTRDGDLAEIQLG
jgi:hypothetical protein